MKKEVYEEFIGNKKINELSVDELREVVKKLKSEVECLDMMIFGGLNIGVSNRMNDRVYECRQLLGKCENALAKKQIKKTI